MEVHPASKSLILKLRDPSRVTALIPRARVVPIDGVNYTQVKFGLDEARVLRNMGIKAPSPIRYFYDWPLRVPGVADPKPFEHQRVSSEFFTLHNRCINLSDMGCVDASTEYLSPEGWVRIDRYAGGHVAQWLPEEQRLEFVAPTEYVKKACHTMVHWKTRFTDQLLSPEHRVLLYRGDGSHVVIHAYQLKTQAAAQDRDLWLHDGEVLFPAFPPEGSEVSHEPSPDGFKYCFMVPSTFLLLRRNGCIFATGNTGKTKSAMWAADYLMQSRVVNKAVIICPKSTLSSVWEDEIRVNFLGRRSCSVLVGSKERRLKLLEQDVDFYIINHDGLKVIEAELKKRTDINLWLYDEAAAVRNPQSQRHKTFAGLVRPTDWMWLMTGTPCPKEPTDVWGLAKLLGSKKIPHYFTAFKNDLMMQLTQYKWVPKPGAFERAYEALSPSIRFKKSDCLDLPPITFTTLMADMTKEQKDAYEMMRKDLVADVAGVQITAAHAATKMQKLLQIGLGMVYDEYGEGYMLDASERLGVCDELIEESTNNAIVFVPYTKALDMVAQHLRKKGHHVEVVDGRTSNTERKRIFSEFQNESGRRILVAHPATTAHGLTLTRADLTIWYGPITDLEIFEQANNRMDRPGQKNNMTVACVACNPLELELYSALKNKQLMQNTILAMFKNELGLPNA